MTGSVLIVDDSLTVRMDLAEAFEEASFAVRPCANLEQARRELAREAADIVILDLILPDGHGVDLLQELQGSQSVILVLSSEAEVKDRIRGLQTGADEYVGKPYDVRYVVARAAQLWRERQSESVVSGSTVLIIEDSDTYRGELGRVLSQNGYAVIAASSGEEGLRLATDRRPDAIVVDGVLPGIDGAAVIRHIRLDAALRGTPCLLLSGSDERGAELRVLEAGADDYVRKEEHFEVILARLTACMRKEAHDQPPSAATLLGPKKILAVDDSPTFLQQLAYSLTGEGYDVVLAHSGEEALDLLAVQPVDCILLDMRMPGLGGPETCRRVKGATGLRETPIVMLTALEDRESMLEGLSAGADDYIAKSSEFEVVRARVRSQLRRKQFEDEKRQLHQELMEKELQAAEARAASELAEARAALIEQLELKNRELEAFSYSVSHDLRAPLRTIEGFGQLLVADYADRLDEQGRHFVERMVAGAQRMTALIDALLGLSRVTRGALRRQTARVSFMAEAVLAELAVRDPHRQVGSSVAPDLVAQADPELLMLVLENLLGNAWKFTAGKADARIEVGITGEREFYVRDNGAGFDMTYSDRLFAPFQRLHRQSDFEGTGIGLATVQRIISRHHGKIWAEAAPGQGATFFFTLGADS